MDPVDTLKRPYARVVTPEADGSFTAEILEFPGCVASGDTASEALSNVEEVAIDWLQASLEQGQNIPEPLDNANHSGKLVLRMSKGLHKRVARWAMRDGISINQFINICIAEAVGERSSRRHFITAPQYIQNINLIMVPTAGSTSSAGATQPKVAKSSGALAITTTPWGAATHA